MVNDKQIICDFVCTAKQKWMMGFCDPPSVAVLEGARLSNMINLNYHNLLFLIDNSVILHDQLLNIQ